MYFFFLQNGETALHIACRRYSFWKRETIDTCVVLIEAGADNQRKSKVSGPGDEAFLICLLPVRGEPLGIQGK